MKKILILGGTHFVGRTVVEELMNDPGVDLTLFNRQRTNTELFAHVRKIKGDRETDNVRQLANEDWDCVIDFCGYYPLSLQRLIDAFHDKIKRYIFISTMSVINFDGTQMDAIDEVYPTLTCSDEEKISTSLHTYGQRKAECERVLQSATWLDSIILRPSIMYGKYDWTDRFYYWLYRVHSASPFLLPDHGRDIITLTYAADLARIIIQSMSIANHRGLYNCTTHPPLTLRESLDAMANVMSTQVNAVNCSIDQLIFNGVQPGVDVPLWFGVPLNVSNERMLADLNYTCKTFEQSIREVCMLYEESGWSVPKAGISLERELELISLLEP